MCIGYKSVDKRRNGCGEEYLSKEITYDILKIAEQDARAGVQVDIREYQAAYA